MVTFSRLLFLLPVLGALAVPSDPTTQPAIEASKSFDFLQHMGELIFNATDGNLERRDTTFSTSKDGVNAAGYYYSLYNDNHAGAGYTEDPNSGHFKVGWNLPSRSEFLGGKGFRGGSTRTLKWDGHFSAKGDYTLAVYGWTTNPVTEWYIVEAHGTGTPGNGHILGQVHANDGIYDVYMLPYRNVPEIYGTKNFNQLWSVRRSHRTTGTVDVTAHFNRWKQLGLQPGNPVFQMVTAEGFQGSGYLDFTLH
ncbi:glycosyl hydrolases family 11 protein [Aspergillus udagawae]|uniref:Endo-1,4-beta-xylanase n=1 Tax=Aspergillus udagawae TaxID=91492 RepID=A0ABQ1B0N7_9EURO|nr:glycosyl hydrolases family 11 protein [Aspergillus udagawae]